MIGHENIKSVIRLSEGPADGAPTQRLWGAVDITGTYGVVTENRLDILASIDRELTTRPFKLYQARPGTVSFRPGDYRPEGEDLVPLSLNGPDVRTRSSFRYLPSGMVAVEYKMTPSGTSQVFSVERREVPEIDAPAALNGNMPSYEAEVTGLTAGCYLDLVLGGMRIARHFDTSGIQGLTPVAAEI